MKEHFFYGREQLTASYGNEASRTTEKSNALETKVLELLSRYVGKPELDNADLAEVVDRVTLLPNFRSLVFAELFASGVKWEQIREVMPHTVEYVDYLF